MGGAFYSVYFLFIDPFSVMHLDLSIMIAMTAMLGGAESLWGPILGAMVLVPLDRYIGVWLGAKITGLDYVIFAAIIMVVAVYQPKGIMGLLKLIIVKIKYKKVKEAVFDIAQSEGFSEKVRGSIS
jgi:branched-chain amino acid transport system permease protein